MAGRYHDAECLITPAGITDGEVIEVTANVALNILTNYVNHVAETVVDFPPVTANAATR